VYLLGTLRAKASDRRCTSAHWTQGEDQGDDANGPEFHGEPSVSAICQMPRIQESPLPVAHCTRGTRSAPRAQKLSEVPMLGLRLCAVRRSEATPTWRLIVSTSPRMGATAT